MKTSKDVQSKLVNFPCLQTEGHANMTTNIISLVEEKEEELVVGMSAVKPHHVSNF